MRWVERWRRVMVSVAVERLGDADAAEDIVQEALTKVLLIARSNPKVVERVRDPRPWLVRITGTWRTTPCGSGLVKNGFGTITRTTSEESCFRVSAKDGRWTGRRDRCWTSRNGS